MRRTEVRIDRSGTGRFVGLFEKLPDGRMRLVESHNAIEGPMPLVDALADEVERLTVELERVNKMLDLETCRHDTTSTELFMERWEKAKESPNTKLAVWLQEHPWRNLYRYYLSKAYVALSLDRWATRS